MLIKPAALKNNIAVAGSFLRQHVGVSQLLIFSHCILLRRREKKNQIIEERKTRSKEFGMANYLT